MSEVWSADVVVVGAGPGGSAAAYAAASAGLDVLVLEKAALGRDKVCGDGLTPRAAAELERLGVAAGAPFAPNRGLRLVADGRAHVLPWPRLRSYPPRGLALARTELDALLARHAVAAGARLVEHATVTGPLLDDATGRVVGVRATLAPTPGPTLAPTPGTAAGEGRAEARDVVVHAPVVVAADGVASRFAVALGIERRDDRPLGVAVRTYYATPPGSPWNPLPGGEEGLAGWMESHVDLWEGEPRRSPRIPGYGWIFPVGGGVVNVGLGSVHSTPARQSAADARHRASLERWVASLPAEWGLTPDNRVGPVRGAALPMGLNRTPLAGRGVLLVGDAAGMVSPFNGEGIGFALQAGRLAGETAARALAAASGLAAPVPDAARPPVRTDLLDLVLATYERQVRAELGGFYTLGRWFTRLIERPRLQQLAVRHGLPRRGVMQVVLRLFSDSYEPRGGDAVDRVVATAARLAPRA